MKQDLRFVASWEEPKTDTSAQAQHTEVGGWQDTLLEDVFASRTYSVVSEMIPSKRFCKELWARELKPREDGLATCPFL